MLWRWSAFELHCDEGGVSLSPSYRFGLTMGDLRRVLVIGGGPCGLVTLRNLLERAAFDDVQLVERRDNIGGVW